MFEHLFKAVRFIDTGIHGVISDVRYMFAKGNVTEAFSVDIIRKHQLDSVLERDKCSIFQAEECWVKLNGIKECFAEAVKLEEMVTIEPSLAYHDQSNSFSPLQLMGLTALGVGVAGAAGYLLYALWRKSAAQAVAQVAAPVAAPFVAPAAAQANPFNPARIPRLRHPR